VIILMKKQLPKIGAALAFALLLGVNSTSHADDSDGDSLWKRNRLTGDWGGVRTKLEDHGVNLTIKGSMFNQNVTSGGVNSGSWQTGFKGDVWANVDAKKAFNSWDGLSFSLHVEGRTGNDVLNESGPFVFPNGPLMYPLPDSYSGVDITGATVNQSLFGGKAAVTAGKLHAFDLLNGFFPNIVDSGLSGFMNANSLMSITSWGRWLTLSQYGAAAWTLEPKFGAQTGILFTGGANVTDTWSFDDSWDGGTGILAFHRFIYTIDDKPGYFFIGVGGSTQDYPVLDPTDWTDFPGEGEPTPGKESNPWEVAFYLYQKVWQAPGNDKRFAQVFMGGSVGDDEVSFSDWDVFASVQTYGFFPSRPRDRIGVAGHYAHLSDNFTSLANLASPGSQLRDNYWTFEAFYNYQVTPWLHVSPSIQYAGNGIKGDDNAVIIGSRMVIDF
jgi:porin